MIGKGLPGGRTAAVFLGMLALTALGCRQDMHDAPRLDPLEASTFFADGKGARSLPEGTVARGHLNEDAHRFEGRDAVGELVTTLPMPLTEALLRRGQSRFEIFCTPCHDATGSGQGMIVRRGFTQPESYHTDRLREMPIGYFFDLMTSGFGQMSSYAAQIATDDRWAIAAYIRALQLSQHVPADELPAAMRASLQGGSDHGDGSHAEDAHGSEAHDRGTQAAEHDGPEPGYGMALPVDDGTRNP